MVKTRKQCAALERQAVMKQPLEGRSRRTFGPLQQSDRNNSLVGSFGEVPRKGSIKSFFQDAEPKPKDIKETVSNDFAEKENSPAVVSAAGPSKPKKPNAKVQKKSKKAKQNLEGKRESADIRVLLEDSKPSTSCTPVVAPSETAKEQAQTEDEVYTDDVFEALATEKLPTNYWKDLAEQRRIALAAALVENKILHEQVEVLEEDNAELKDIVEAAKVLTESL